MSVAEADDTNLIRTLLRDVRSFLTFLIDVVSDDEMAMQTFGFTFDLGLVSTVDAVIDLLDQSTQGDPDLPQLIEAAARLAEVTSAVRLAFEALEGGGGASEVAGAALDTVALGYFAARWPLGVFLARLLRLAGENVAIDSILSGLEKGLGAPLETEEDARRKSIYLAVLGTAVALTPPLVQLLLHRTIDPDMLKVLYGWERQPDSDPDSTPSDADLISHRFVTVLLRLRGAPALAGAAEVEEHELLNLTVTMALVPRVHGGPGLWLSFGLGADADLDLGSGWHVVVENRIDDAFDVFLASPVENSFLRGGASVGVSAEVRVERREEGTVAPTGEAPTGGTPAGETPIGAPIATPVEPWRFGGILEVRTAEVFLKIGDRQPMAEAGIRLRDAAVVIPRPESGFLRRLVPHGGLRADFDLGFVVDSTPRVYLEGGTGAEMLIPIHTSTPALQGLHVFIALHARAADAPPGGPPVTLEVSTGFSTRLGGFSMTVDRFGVVLPQARHPLPGATWLRFPDTIGIGLDFGSVQGGGLIKFDPEQGRYAGMLALTVSGRFSCSAFGLLTDLDDGYSLLVVLSIEWLPPLPLPFGIGLTGVGGILGHNHTTNVATLQAAMRTGAVGTMLFPADPVAAAPRVLTTLANVFPVREGSSLLGFGLKLTWSGGLVTMTAALVAESGPTPRLILLASLDIAAPTKEQRILHLRVDAAGIIDPARPSVEIDGSLVDSFIGPFSLTGDATFRFRGGDDGLFLLAVGGFHPAYTPPANANLAPQRRLTLALPMENPRVRLDQYWAITSNTIQVGARLEVSARKGGFTAEALIGFDALAQRDPFHLSADIEARAAIRYDGSTLASVGLDLHLDGPDPWHLHGKARLELFFFTVSVPIDTTFGDDSPDAALPIADAAALLTAALHDPANWETTRPDGAASLVVLRRTAQQANELAAHPGGRLGVVQNVLPLGISVTHMGRARIAPDRFDVDDVAVGGVSVSPIEQRAPFAAGEFVDLAGDERLSRPSFENFVAGFLVGGSTLTSGVAVEADLTYEEIVIGPDGPLDEPPRRRPGLRGVLVHAAAVGAAGTSSLRRADLVAAARAGPRVRLADVTHLVLDAATLQRVDVAHMSPRATETELRQAVAAGATGPGARVVVLAHEAAQA